MSALDFNFNFGVPTGQNLPGWRCRPRFNTDIYARLIDTTGVVVPQPTNPGNTSVPPHNYPQYPDNWDADLHACMYLRDFEITFSTGGNTWFDRYSKLSALTNIPGGNMSQQDMRLQVLGILELALEREDRYAEVIDQDDADGAMNYYLGMLKINPANNPATNLLVHVGRRIGEHVAMCLKGYFLAPRPSQLAPAIVPMIDPPLTPSFPAGHAVQSYLISYLLAYSLKNFPQQTKPLPNPAQSPPPDGLLFNLAARISENRIVAGVHYPIDIEAGIAVAVACFNDLSQISTIQTLMTAVGNEFPQYK